ncbi:MAG TPA: PQQ-dependent sugar dehydrogenase, partial [Gemmatimonadales bacterium]|nr:PQQ-dependent sugar dehydrogenase [Gemmatimonadales bacterium]
ITFTATDQAGAVSAASLALTVRTALPPLGLDLVAGGLSQPVFLTSAPGDASRLFVVEKTGAIRVIHDGTLLAAPFLDLTDSVTSGSEQGLLGLAFYPDYATSGRFIVSYTSPHGAEAGGTSVIARYRVSGSPDAADPASGRTLLTLDQPYTNHNGGMAAFGPDGYLYLGFGDGGGGGDPLGTGQDRSDLYASMLRLDVSGSGAYAIPPTNPYLGSATFRPELWNWGLRNPWRWSFDRQTGDLYIGDVGQNEREEVDVQPAGQGGGANYGWSVLEGLACYNSSSCDRTGITLPVLDYDHSQGCAITGGYVYRGSAIPALRGRYLYSDYCSGWVRSFRYQNGQAADRQEHSDLAPGQLVTSFGEDGGGELYILVQGGSVYRIVPR